MAFLSDPRLESQWSAQLPHEYRRHLLKTADGDPDTVGELVELRTYGQTLDFTVTLLERCLKDTRPDGELRAQMAALEKSRKTSQDLLQQKVPPLGHGGPVTQAAPARGPSLRISSLEIVDHRRVSARASSTELWHFVDNMAWITNVHHCSP